MVWLELENKSCQLQSRHTGGQGFIYQEQTEQVLDKAQDLFISYQPRAVPGKSRTSLAPIVSLANSASLNHADPTSRNSPTPRSPLVKQAKHTRNFHSYSIYASFIIDLTFSSRMCTIPKSLAIQNSGTFYWCTLTRDLRPVSSSVPIKERKRVTYLYAHSDRNLCAETRLPRHYLNLWSSTIHVLGCNRTFHSQWRSFELPYPLWCFPCYGPQYASHKGQAANHCQVPKMTSRRYIVELNKIGLEICKARGSSLHSYRPSILIWRNVEGRTGCPRSWVRRVI